MRTIAIVSAIIFSTTVHARGDWDFAAPHKSRCAEGGQQQMNSCLVDEYRKVDARLNEAYKKIMSDLEDPSKLKNAQVAWLRFRDLTCEYTSSGIGQEGSLYSFAKSACLIDLSEKRIRDLQVYWQWNCNGCPPRKSP